jgi:class 3 adenylate cyclase
VYEVFARPRNLLGRVAVPLALRLVVLRRFEAAFRRYDEAVARERELPRPRRARLAPGASGRLAAARGSLVGEGVSPPLVDRLAALLEEADDLALASLRPYVLAAEWGVARREALELCLRATRHGLLELRWELLCPLCRGAAATEESLAGVAARLHCATCLIDFEVDFDRSVELTFRPSPAIRRVEAADFCVAGPQTTPHVVAQQLLAAGDRRSLALAVEPGSYRVRSLGAARALRLLVRQSGPSDADGRAGPDGWEPAELAVAAGGTLRLENATAEEQLVVVERTEWSESAATAAEVTALQLFRDLFSSEALRPGEPISVGTLTVVFTDLRGSTRFYRDVGDAPAFGSVVEHLALLREAVAAEDGAVVKAMGDAIMAVFPRPVSALRALQAAQRAVDGKPLALKVGIHTGPCIAIDQNGVLDYFGSTVNLAARLVSLSSGEDVVVSDAVLADPEVAGLPLRRERVHAVPKGFEGEELALWRVSG